jgi:hypothetical protein
MTLEQRMRSAAATLEELSALYGYRFPHEAAWSATELRTEAQHLETTTPVGLYDVNCAGHTGGCDD